MTGMTELFILLSIPLIGLVFIASAVIRLRRKLAAGAKPSLGTYVNELGGYILAGLLLLALGIAAVIMQLLGMTGSN